MKLLSAKEAAKKLGVHHTGVKVLIWKGRLKAQKIGGAWIINEKDLKKLKIFSLEGLGNPRGIYGQ
jgi:excisionase family DNA binding protein